MVSGNFVAADRTEFFYDDVLGIGEFGRTRYRAGHDTNPDLTQSGMTEGTSW